ncbi:flocculation protein FLO11-like [Haliotis rufescens]|uniref:flocculation protein FLO11-like n=1 Tax=Haliotis rufescens TaxID=6454 RepID=UPI00201ED5B4|nr:flocculation protein FLO11-like [Haliotis rufescens]
MNLNDQVCLWILTTILVVKVKAQNSSSGMDDLSKAFISAAGLVAVGVIAFVVSKLVDYCYDRATLNDDASDISEHTRKLIRARIALSHFKKPKSKKKKKKKLMTPKEKKKNTKRFFKLWSSNAKRRGSQRSTDNVINVEEANANDKLPVKGTVKKSLAHVTFIDELEPQTEGGINVPVISITEPESHYSSKSTKDSVFKAASKEPPRPPQKDNGKASENGRTPVTAKATPVSGRTTPVKDVSGKSSPQKDSPVKGSPVVVKRPVSGGRTTPTNTGINTGRSSPAKDIFTISPLVAASGKSSPSKDVGRKDHPRSSSTSPTKLSSGTKPSTGSQRPKTAPSPRPAANNKIVAVKPAAIQKNASTPKPVPKTPSKGSLVTPRSSSPVKSGPGGKNTTKNTASHSAGDWAEVKASTRTAASVAVSVDEDLHKKYVHFRGDSDDLLIPVSTDVKPTKDPKSFEKDVNSSSSGDYDFLQSDQKKSLTKNKSGKNSGKK